MNDPSVTDLVTPSRFCGAIADELRLIADDIDKIGESDLAEPRYVHLHMQPADRTDNGVIATVDTIGLAILGKPGIPQKMLSGDYHYSAGGKRGPIEVNLYRSISTERATQIFGSQELAAKEDELARLRAEVAELRSRDALAYSREPDDPTPVSPARVPLHTGAMTDCGLVDETSAVELGERAAAAIRKFYGEPCQGAPAGYDADCGISGEHGPHGLEPERAS